MLMTCRNVEMIAKEGHFSVIAIVLGNQTGDPVG
jgi:hypothetical protein